jgi:hypothetical protein
MQCSAGRATGGQLRSNLTRRVATQRKPAASRDETTSTASVASTRNTRDDSLQPVASVTRGTRQAGRQSKAAPPVCHKLSVPSAGCVLCASANKQTNKPVAAAVSSSSPPSHGLACIGLPPSPLAPQAPDAARLWSSGRAHTHQWRRGNWNRTDASYGTHFPLQWTRTAGVCDRGQPNRSV